jgi:hypothetical protein
MFSEEEAHELKFPNVEPKFWFEDPPISTRPVSKEPATELLQVKVEFV